MDDFLNTVANHLSDPKLWVVMILLVALFPIYSRVFEWLMTRKYNNETPEETLKRAREWRERRAKD